MRFPIRAVLPALALVATGTLYAQQTELAGNITDQSGAAIPGASVHAAPAAGGAALAVQSTKDGVYHFPFLQAGDYVLRVEASGFTTVEKKLTLLVGQSLSIDISLPVASASGSVEVIADNTTVSTISSEVSSNITPQQMKDVPLNGRNWLELALLVPGITKNDMDNSNPVAGADSGRFQLNIDQQQVTENLTPGGGQPRFSRDVLSEFQIITNRFDVTQGRSINAVINAQSRSGTDLIHGAAYAYFRNNNFNAADFVAKTVLPYSDQQYGGTFGGPVFKGKAWYFAGYEGERSPNTIYTTPTNFPGQSFTLANTQTTKTALARLDYQRSDRDRFFLRAAAFQFANPLSGIGGTDHPSRGVNAKQEGVSGVLGWTRILSSSTVNDLKLGFAYFGFANYPTVLSQEYRFNSTTVGGNYNYPGIRFQNVWSMRDDFSWTHGAHSMRMGGEYLNTWVHGIFQQNVRGTVTSFSSVPSDLGPYFPVWNDTSTWRLDLLGPISTVYVQGFGNFNLAMYRHSIGAWFQDDWKVLPRLTLNLGVRYDVDLGMTGSSTTLKSGLLTPHGADGNNFGPRVGFAWDTFGTGKTVFRGGAGLFYSDVQANQYYNQQVFNGEQSIQASVQATSTTKIDLTKPFGSLTGAQILANGSSVAQSVQLVYPDVKVPYAFEESFGVAQGIGAWTVQADWVNWRLYHQWIRTDQNLTYDPTTGFNLNPTTYGRPDSRFTTILRFGTPGGAGAYANQLQIQVRRRFSHGISFASAYTLSNARDSSGGAFYVPNNQFNLKDEWSRSAGDQTSTFNMNGSYKFKYGFQLSGLYRYGSGNVFATTAAGSPFGNGGSNRTFLSTAKTYNPTANNYTSTAAGYMLTKRDGFVGQPIHRVDMRLQKTFHIKERLTVTPIAEVFNLFNHANYGSYQTAVTTVSYGQPAQNTSLSYGPRTGQFAVRIEF